MSANMSHDDEDVFSIYDSQNGGWKSGDAEFADDMNQHTQHLLTNHGEAALPRHGETAEEYRTRMQDDGFELSLAPDWHRDLQTVQAVKEAEAAGTLVLYADDEPDAIAEASAAIRAMPVHQRFREGYLPRRAELLK